MTTPPGQDPRPSPTRGGPGRQAPRGADSGWPVGNPDGRGTGQGRGSAGLGRDDVDGRRVGDVDGRGGGDAGGTSVRPRRPARADADPWGTRGARGQGWNGRGDRDTVDQGWSDGQTRGAGRRGARERSPLPGTERGAGRRGYRSADGDPRGAGVGDDVGGRGPADPPGALSGLRQVPIFRWMGALRTRSALYILLGAAVVGVVGTLMAGTEPGNMLGLLIIIGSVLAALGIRRRAIYLLIPLPALALFCSAVLTGYVHDNSIETTKAELGATFLQWIANVFVAMCAATILVLVIGAGRWLLSRQFVSGQFSMTEDRPSRARGSREAPPPGRRADRERRPSWDQDRWSAADPWGDRGNPDGQRTNRPGTRGPYGPSDRGERNNRDPRDRRDPREPRDPWGAR